MQICHVQASRPYDIFIGRDLLTDCGSRIRAVNSGTHAVIVSDSHVSPLYGAQVEQSLKAAGYAVSTFVFEAGEERKRLETIAQIYAKLAEASVTRSDVLVALGGGVTGDMTGFAAATWLRGVDFVQIPTTLLAQVDSSVGGKTGVDTAQGKNLVGAFHQPRLVLADLDTLSTLPNATFADGMAEIIKAACIRSKELFELLEAESAPVPSDLEEVVSRSIAIKQQTVERDEKESGERKLLNFGHTLGHALERRYGYSGLTHGSGVAIGMMKITAASEQAGLTEPGTTARLKALLEAYRLPVGDRTPLNEYLPFTGQDKKRAGNRLDLVLLHRIGEGFLYPLEISELAAFLRETGSDDAAPERN